MRCNACGAEVLEEAVYCHKCGARVDMQIESYAAPEGRGEEPAYGMGAQEQGSTNSTQGGAGQFKEALNARGESAGTAEEELWTGGYATRAMVGAWILSGLITVGLFILGIWAEWGATGWQVLLVLILLMWLFQFVVLARRKISVRYRLTSQRFFHETGILRHVTDRIEVIDMDDVTFEQTLLERLVGVGTICITSSDRTHPELTIPGIQNVAQVAAMIDEARHAERMRRGLHIETI